MKTFLRALLFTALGLSAQALWATPVELVLNGDFETGDLGGWSQSGLTGYQAVSTDTLGPLLTRHTGFVFSEGADISNGYISQMIATSVGATYTLKFDLQRLDTRNAGDALTNFEEVTFGAVTVFSQINVADNDWMSYTFNNLIGTGGLVELKFGGRNVYNYIQLDNISLVADTVVGPGPSGPPAGAVPEPASIATLLLGLGALGWTRRKRT
jgi:hypothetical protein